MEGVQDFRSEGSQKTSRIKQTKYYIIPLLLLYYGHTINQCIKYINNLY